MDVLYGLHPVEEAIRAGGSRRLEYILLSRERSSRLDKLAEMAKVAGVRVTLERQGSVDQDRQD